MKNQLEQILQQDMTRKEFLQYVGGALLAALGITALLRNLMQHKPAAIQQADFGYGGGSYGGAKKVL